MLILNNAALTGSSATLSAGASPTPGFAGSINTGTTELTCTNVMIPVSQTLTISGTSGGISGSITVTGSLMVNSGHLMSGCAL